MKHFSRNYVRKSTRMKYDVWSISMKCMELLHELQRCSHTVSCIWMLACSCLHAFRGLIDSESVCWKSSAVTYLDPFHSELCRRLCAGLAQLKRSRPLWIWRIKPTNLIQSIHICRLNHPRVKAKCDCITHLCSLTYREELEGARTQELKRVEAQELEGARTRELKRVEAQELEGARTQELKGARPKNSEGREPKNSWAWNYCRQANLSSLMQPNIFALDMTRIKSGIVCCTELEHRGCLSRTCCGNHRRYCSAWK